ncbi:unnamed protein product [Dovyalis caffra]|uniref:non-specific serine/threonine protein kinase n=1 Tax=Dovyalis caffra TaxID=77055 RepID=A0AAV1RZD4_9ROSI|nr:unnamed protein product [Dovyalis caffra]
MDFDSCEVVEKDPTGRYSRYDEILGKGGLKTIYKGFDEVNGVEVAWNRVKIEDVVQSPQQIERMYSEVHLHKSLKHGNIIKFYNYWVDEKKMTMNMVTETSASGTLRQYFKKHRSVNVKVIKKWARQILQGLHYLHSQEPPVVHRNLKCDNVFINGNNGGVKIGDFGLAIVLQQPSAAGEVLGSPEFMAPELYEEEYNELVDIYSFGMCMLEMVTCDYPYSECKNPGEIYEKVISGVRPVALDNVDDPQVKEFIEKCLVPASLRLPASELLKDPFLSAESPKELVSSSLQSPNLIPKQVSLPQSESHSMDSDKKKISVGRCTRSMDGAPIFSTQEFQRFTENKEFTLRGKKKGDNTISLTLRIAEYPCGQARNIDFDFYLDSDTAVSVSEEMVEQLDLSIKDAALIVELIDSMILKFIPSWNSEVSSIRKANEPKLELDAIDSHYLQCFQEVLRRREEAIEDATKRWLAKKISAM